MSHRPGGKPVEKRRTRAKYSRPLYTAVRLTCQQMTHQDERPQAWRVIGTIGSDFRSRRSQGVKFGGIALVGYNRQVAAECNVLSRAGRTDSVGHQVPRPLWPEVPTQRRFLETRRVSLARRETGADSANPPGLFLPRQHLRAAAHDLNEAVSFNFGLRIADCGSDAAIRNSQSAIRNQKEFSWLSRYSSGRSPT